MLRTLVESGHVPLDGAWGLCSVSLTHATCLAGSGSYTLTQKQTAASRSLKLTSLSGD